MFHKLSGIENFMENRRGGREGGSIKIFRENFLSPVSKNFIGGCFSVCFVSGIEKC